ncbi:helix-turn-helix domain-containing protein [Shewanella surugensis]|uniref:Helix-turn-helix transcriptional regulator n=1 Tax=Shewanella surugensis TaxID=212020 RepID=A0ABT0L8V0_9GAMM|nr:helix-turn-helix transcriptional regulator [Shewanella surugensis]MCL1124129.1 helix-turn-helix transcriptional regulator [Shewanella surugensis]
MYTEMSAMTKAKPLWAIRAEEMMGTKGITQEDLLDVFDVGTRGSVGHRFSGRQLARIEEVQRLAKKLGTTVSYLIGDSDELPTSTDQHKDINDHSVLAKSFQYLARIDKLNDSEIKSLFQLLEKLDLSRVIQVYEVLHEIERTGDVSSIIKLEDFRKIS